MKTQPSTEKQISRALLLLLTAVVCFFFAWIFFIEPRLTRLVESFIGKEVWNFPEPFAFLYSFLFGLVPPFGVAAGAYAFAYFRWFIPNRTKLANEQLQKLSDARLAMTTAVAYIESFEQELKQKSTEAEKLRDEVLSLKSLNAESVVELEKKLKAMESLTRNRIWFERIFAFVIGILSSLVASYLWLAVQPQHENTKAQTNLELHSDSPQSAR